VIPPARLLIAGAILAAAASAARAQEAPPVPPEGKGAERPRAAYSLSFGLMEAEVVEGEAAAYLVGGVSFQRGPFSLEAENAVLWIDPENAKEEGGALAGIAARASGREGKDGGPPRAPPLAPAAEARGPGFGVPEELRPFLGPVLIRIYAEGGVRFRLGNRTLRADRLFADFRTHALGTGRVTTTVNLNLPTRGRALPLVVRAERMRRTTMDTLRFEGAEYSTCDFADAHYSFRATSFEITDEADHYSIAAWNNVLRVEGVPILYLPYLAGSSNLTARPIRSASVGRSSRFGLEFHLELGDDVVLRDGKWGEWRFHLDQLTRRGHGGGPEVLYDRPDHEGHFQATYQRDRAGSDLFDDSAVPRKDRGRVRWEHRQRFTDRLRLDLSLFDFSDRNFQPEYLKEEFLEDRDPETYASLRWRGDQDTASLSVKARPDAFRTETTELPDGTWRRLAAPLPPSLAPPWLVDGANLSVDARAGAYERAFDEERGLRGDRVLRQDAAARVEALRRFGPVAVSPFASAGATAWQGIGGGDRGGEDARADLAAGARAEVEARREFPAVESRLLDLRGLRHLASLEVLWFDRFAVTRDPPGARSVDALDRLDEARAGQVRLRNRLQTTRGGRREDWIDLELRGLYLPDGLDPRRSPLRAKEEGIEGIRFSDFLGEEKYRAYGTDGRWGPYEADLRVQARDNLYLLGEAEYDAGRRDMITTAQGVRWFVVPRFSVYFGRRTITRDSDIFTATADWFPSERWGFHLAQQTDFRSNEGLKSAVGLRRVWHDFVLEIDFKHDQQTGETSFGLSFIPSSLWNPPTSAEKLGRLDFEAQRWYR
jgi:hypothetical protein